MTSSRKVPVSVLIPTRDEERNIAACIDSLSWADEIVVFDSYSTDPTVDIARAKGATVVQRVFDSFSAHKNWALDNIDFHNDWIFIVDADERASDSLAAEIDACIARSDRLAGYYVARENWAWGRRLHCMSPDYQLRLVRRGRARYEDRIVHEHMRVDGDVGFLKQRLRHHDDKGIERYFERHNHYTSLEAVEIHRMLRGLGGGPLIPGDITAKGPERRRAIKNFAYRHLPMRALAIFLYMYFWKLGFLDGRIGFRYCLIRAFHEYQIGLKLKELKDPNSAMSTKYRRFLE